MRMDWLGARTYLLAAGLGQVNLGMRSNHARLGRAEAFAAAVPSVRHRARAG